MTKLISFATLALLALVPARVGAQDVIQIDQLTLSSATPIADSLAKEAATLAADAQGQRPVAIEYSDAHETRAKIHRYVSWAALPLMATEFALGEKLYNDPNSVDSSSRGVHAAVGAGLISVFGVQSVTGVWNLVESNQAPGRTKRWVHGLMMLAAEGGFVAAAATAPGHGRSGSLTFDADKATHRDIAIVSLGVGTAGYLLMLLTGGSH
jgi:hypothetical protein